MQDFWFGVHCAVERGDTILDVAKLLDGCQKGLLVLGQEPHHWGHWGSTSSPSALGGGCRLPQVGQSSAGHYLVTAAIGEEEGEGSLGGSKRLLLPAAALGPAHNGMLLLVRHCNNSAAELLFLPIDSCLDGLKCSLCVLECPLPHYVHCRALSLQPCCCLLVHLSTAHHCLSCHHQALCVLGHCCSVEVPRLVSQVLVHCAGLAQQSGTLLTAVREGLPLVTGAGGGGDSLWSK